jgi:hypothetical protein
MTAQADFAPGNSTPQNITNAPVLRKKNGRLNKKREKQKKTPCINKCNLA